MNSRMRRITDKLSHAVTAEMIATFNVLVVHLTTILSCRMSMEKDKETGETTFQNFRQYVASVCNNRRIRLKNSVLEIFDKIKDMGCYDQYGDPYDFLLIVVKGVGNIELVAELTTIVEEYQAKHYSQYLVAIMVVDHITTLQSIKLPDRKDYEPDYNELSIKLDYVNVNECSIDYLTNLWQAVKRFVRLPNLYSVLARIEKGCLSVTWLVPVYAGSSLMDLPRYSPKLFIMFPILRMSINGVNFYEVNSVKVVGAPI